MHNLTVLHACADRPALLGAGRSAEVFAAAPGRAVKLFVAGSDPAAIEAEFRAASHAARLGLPVARPHGLVTCEAGAPGSSTTGPRVRASCSAAATTRFGSCSPSAASPCCSGASTPNPAPACPTSARCSPARSRGPGSRIPPAAPPWTASPRCPRGTPSATAISHTDNVIATREGWRVVDWQKAHRGHPAADVARSALLIRYGRLAGPGPSARLRALVAMWYVLCYRQGPGPRTGIADVQAWMLPVAAARLAGRVADNEEALRAEVERLAA